MVRKATCPLPPTNGMMSIEKQELAEVTQQPTLTSRPNRRGTPIGCTEGAVLCAV
jgi:hypothetical protein